MEQTVPSKRDVYYAITEKIIEAIECGAADFRMPWHSPLQPASLPMNATTYANYHGVNVLSLWIEALTKAYPTGLWASYQQWRDAGAQVRKGERGTMIVFYKPVEDEVGEENRARFVARASYVFNVAQVDGWRGDIPASQPEYAVDKAVEAFVAVTEARISHGFATAQYRRDIDEIQMPNPQWFTGRGGRSPLHSYYAVLLHELTHWSGAAHRLNREFGKRFGDEAYAFEELIAELGAAFLCAALGLANEPRRDHASYIAGWLRILGNDSRAVFTAASQAQTATEFLLRGAVQD